MNNTFIENNYDNPTIINSSSYLNSLVLGKEGEAEIEYRSFRRYKWMKAFLVLNNNDLIIYQSSSKATILYRWMISVISKVEPKNDDQRVLVLKTKSHVEGNEPYQQYRLRFFSENDKDDWFYELRKVILINSKHQSKWSNEKILQNCRAAFSDDEASSPFIPDHYFKEEVSTSKPPSSRKHLHRGSMIDVYQKEDSEDPSIRTSPVLSDYDIKNILNEAEEHLLTKDRKDPSPTDSLQSGCASGVSFQNKKPENEDRIFINTRVNYYLRHGSCEMIDSSRESQWCEYQKGTGKALFAIFDGHNGDCAASWCKDHLLDCFISCYRQGVSSEEVIKKVVEMMEERLKKEILKNVSGCTCTLVFLNSNELTVANVGDTQAFLARENGLEELTEVHDAINDQLRIRKAGGWITSLKEETRIRLGSIVSPMSSSPHSSSPLPFVSTGSSTSSEVVNETPSIFVNRIRNRKYFVNGELEVSRSLGDYYLKKENISQRSWHYPTVEREAAGIDGFVDDVVSAVPSIKNYRLRGDDRFIIIATDGLWEVINPKACISIVHHLISRFSLNDICNILFWISQQQGSYDNVSIILVDLFYSSGGSRLSYD